MCTCSKGLVVLLCGDGLFGPRAAEGTCSEGPIAPLAPGYVGVGLVALLVI